MKSPICILWIRHPSLTDDIWMERQRDVGGYRLLPKAKRAMLNGCEALILPKGTHPSNIEQTND